MTRLSAPFGVYPRRIFSNRKSRLLTITVLFLTGLILGTMLLPSNYASHNPDNVATLQLNPQTLVRTGDVAATPLKDDALIKFRDADGDGIRDGTATTGECVFYDTDSDGVFDTGEAISGGTLCPGTGAVTDDPKLKYVDFNGNDVRDSVAPAGPEKVFYEANFVNSKLDPGEPLMGGTIPATTSTGTTFDQTFEVADAQDVFAWAATVTFDPDVLYVSLILLGPYFDQAGEIDPTPGCQSGAGDTCLYSFFRTIDNPAGIATGSFAFLAGLGTDPQPLTCGATDTLDPPGTVADPCPTTLITIRWRVMKASAFTSIHILTKAEDFTSGSGIASATGHTLAEMFYNTEDGFYTNDATVVPPDAEYTATPSPIVDVNNPTVNFDATASLNAGSYSWDFGDGTPAASGPTTTHTYPAIVNRDYRSVLTVAGPTLGTSSKATKMILVRSPPVTNLPPVLDAIPDKTVNEGAPLTFTATASDPDAGQTLAWTLEPGAPLGASIDPATGAFSWTPTEAQGPSVTPYSITVTVTDSGTPPLSDSKTFMVTVNEVNSPPVLTVPGPQTGDEGSLITFTATATDPDIPPNTLSFSLAAGAPSGTGIDSLTGVFTWTPSEGQGPGDVTVTVIVSDSGTPQLSDSKPVPIHVNEVNQPPVLTVPGPQTIAAASLLTFSVSATDPDQPPNTITLSVDPATLPSGASFDPATGIFSWTPTAAQAGPHTVSFKATDDGTPSLFDTKSVMVTVTVNQPPLLTVPGAQIVDEGQVLTFTVSATDSDSATITLSATGLPAGATFPTVTGNPVTGTFSWTPGEDQGPADYTITFRADDGNGNIVSLTVDIHVNEVNRAPSLTVPGPQAGDEGSLITFAATATDPDTPANTFTFSLGAGAPSGSSIDPVTGIFSWTPSEAQGPTDVTITIIVMDNGSPQLSDSKTVDIHVNEVNQAPALTVPGPQTGDEGSLITFIVTAADSDVPANGLSFSLGPGAPAGASIHPATGVFSWTPSEAQGPNDYTVTIIVMDDGSPSLSDSQTVSIHVNEVNQPPALTVPGPRSAAVGTTLTFTVTATDPDIPANLITLSADPATMPSGSSFDPAIGLFSFTPVLAQNGMTFTVSFKATDDGSPSLSDTRTVDITVTVNQPPVLTVPGAQTIGEGGLLGFTVTTTDNDSATITLSASNLPTGAMFPTVTGNPVTGTFSWTPGEDQGPNDYTITFSASDGDGNIVTMNVNIHVDEVNRSPSLAVPGAQNVDEGSLITFTVTATDPDLPANSITLSVDPATLPAGASFDPATGTFSWTPSEAQGPNDYTVTFRATDDGSPQLQDSKTVSIHVNEVNLAPALTVPGPQTGGEGSLITFTAIAVDPDSPANTLTFSLGAGAPTGASIHPVTGVFSWTPSETQGPNDYTVTIVVMDDGSPSLSDSKTVSIRVDEVNLPPVLTVPGPQSVSIGSPLTLTITAADPDEPPSIITLSVDTLTLPTGASFNPDTGVFSWTPTAGQEGMYTVSFTATDNGIPSLSDTKSVMITVARESAVPIAVKTHSPSVIFATETITFDGTESRDPDGGLILSYLWEFDFNNDGIVDQTSTTPTAAIVFPAQGHARITLTVTDDEGQTGSVSQVVTVEPEPGFIRGKVHYTHHLRDTATQVFSFKIENPSSVTVAVTITVELFDEFGMEVEPSPISEIFILGPRTMNTDAQIPWSPPDLPPGTSLGVNIEARISYKAIEPGPDGILGTPDDVVLATGTNNVSGKGIINKRFTIVSVD